jgi:hypothetical protein
MLSPNLTDSQATVREEDLKIPTLIVLAKASQAKIPGITVSELADALESINNLSAADQAITPGDRVSRFRRQVLNLISHNTLQSQGWISPKAPAAGQTATRYVITSEGRAQLARVAIAGIGMPSAARPAVSATSRTLEKSIAIPALFILANLEMDMGSPVPMSMLRKALKNILPSSPADMVILAGRTDTRLDQVIRNLISHSTLETDKWMKRTPEGMTVTNVGYGVLLDTLIGALPTPATLVNAKATAPSLASAADLVSSASDAPSADSTPAPRRPRPH